jgi:hypothetical protein
LGTAHIRFTPPRSDGKKLPLSGFPRGIRSGDEELAQKNVTLIAACLAEETSKEDQIGEDNHGLLTYFLAEALEGVADENKDNLLSYKEVWQYARGKVTHYVENKWPWDTQNVQLECFYPENPVFQSDFISGDYSKELVLKGAVIDGQGRRVNRALVGVLPQGTTSISRETLIAYGRTDDSGFFTANNKIKAGRYTVKVVAEGYATLWQEVEIQESKESGVSYLKITLTRE